MQYHPRAKSGFLAVLFSLVPGCGLMYMGLMARGAQYLAAFFLGLLFLSVMPMQYLGLFFALLVLCYNVFDTLHIHRQLKLGFPVEDKGFVDFKMPKITAVHIGILMLILGGMWGVKIVENLLWQYNVVVLARIINVATNFVGPAGLVLIGLYVLLRGRRNPS